MDLTSFFNLIINFFKQLFFTLDSKAVFTAFGVQVSLLTVIGAIVVLTMVIGIFWRGAKG